MNDFPEEKKRVGKPKGKYEIHSPYPDENP